jgi:hydroxymethylpyrimidine/phosphomethylpyrimidine kinase
VSPRILIIAGSDSGGGAGIQADIKTVTMLGGHAMTAVTAITAQNTLGVQAVHPVPTEMVLAQIESCVSDIGVDAVKIGMIGSAETAAAVFAVLDVLRTMPSLAGGGTLPIVVDPVMVATSGDALADASTVVTMGALSTIATLVTPNLPELAALGGEASLAAMAPAILVKGGHGEGDRLLDRLVTREGEVARWESDRIATTSTHGTGCTLASAIATYLAYGYPLKAAVARARQFVRIALKDAPGLGGGHGPMGHQKVRLDLGPGLRLNQTTLPMAAESEAFYRTLGLTQIVDTEDGHYARFEAAGGATLSVEQGAAPTVFFECEDLDADVARLQAAGVVFDHLPVAQEWLWREARLTDPAGNALCLYQADENRRYPPWRLAP